MNSWEKKLPEYELIRWDEDRFDVNSNLYVRQAYQAKKYAFVADYVRLYALFHFGGVYVDTDVEVLKPLDSLLSHKAFSGFEDAAFVPTGIMAAKKGNGWIKELLDYYSDKVFIKPDGSFNTLTNTKIITENCLRHGLIQNGQYQELRNGVVFYPRTYFSPYDYKNGDSYLGEESYTIHHFSQTWLPWHLRYKRILKIKCMQLLGKQRVERLIGFVKT